MKKVVRASENKKTFKVYFNDGNQKLIEADHIYDALAYVVFEQNYSASDIYKVEEVEV